MEKILCIGASIALPREKVPYEDTWFYMLSEKWKNKCCFIHYFTRALLMPQIQMQYDLYFKYYNADYVIWQSGLTDSAPRIINERATIWRIIINIVNRLGWQKHFWKIIKFLKKRDPKCVNTNYSLFCSLAEQIVDGFVANRVKKIIIIKIGQVGESVQRKSPHYQSNIHLYNTCYDNLKKKYPDRVVIIDPLKNANDKLYVDGIHTNRDGSCLVFNQIDCVLQGLID